MASTSQPSRLSSSAAWGTLAPQRQATARTVVADRSVSGAATRSTYRWGWLIWLAIAAAATLPPLGLDPLLVLCVSLGCVMAWVVGNVSPKRVVASFLISVMDIFFREIGARNQFKVPPEGWPVIFVCAPHSNQFLDPFVVMKAVRRTDLCYLTAAKSMRKRFIGSLARALESIPVERAQDSGFAGAGEVWLSEDGVTLSGRGTSFAAQVKPNDTVRWGGSSGVVQAIASDDSLTLKPTSIASGDGGGGGGGGGGAGGGGSSWTAYHVLPRVAQDGMFSAVYDTLAAGKAVGIFPEGGSHDQPSLLPLKAGIAIMALGALARYPGLQLKLVPVGIHYFSGHRFRSRVFLDIGAALDVPAPLLAKYEGGGDGKHEATSELMELVENALSAVTTSAPDYETLEFFWTLRRLTRKRAEPLSLGQQVAFARRFAVGYDETTADGRAWKEQPKVRRVREMCAEYNSTLKQFGLRDYQVANVMDNMTRRRAAALVVGRSLQVLLLAATLVPTALLAWPLLLLTRIIAWVKARQAVANSKVKIHGRDVVATWKVLISLGVLPLLWLFYTGLACALAASSTSLAAPWPREICLLTFFFLPFLFYGGTLAGERVANLARSLPPLVMCVVRPESALRFIEMRSQLKIEMRDLVDETGWKHDLEEATPSPIPHNMSVNTLSTLEELHTASSSPLIARRGPPVDST